MVRAMLRITKLTDYGIVMMAHFAKHDVDTLVSAREVADATRISPPTVSKLLKMLTKQELLHSVRGANGGYRLGRSPEHIDVSEIIEALEGPLAMTECADSRVSSCEGEDCCPLRDHWRQINLAVKTALKTITLADLAAPVSAFKFAPSPVLKEQADA